MPFGFEQALDSINEGLQDLKQVLGLDAKPNELSKEGKIYSQQEIENENLWVFKGQDWYKIFGYQFVVQKANANGSFGGGSEEFIYTLPIPPQSFNIRMIPATQATPTIGGVVEETNQNVFWLLSLAGTTGIAVGRGDDTPAKRHKMAKQFRDSISTTGLLSGAAAGLNSAIGNIAGTADALGSGDLVGAFNTAFLPSMPYSASAVSDKTNGYTEMQELHRFLYAYSMIKGKAPSKYKLKFRCYKNNQEWDIIVQDFNIQKSASNPMLYRYNIALKGWSVSNINTDKEEFDRFGPDGDLKSVNLVTPESFQKINSKFFNNKFTF